MVRSMSSKDEEKARLLVTDIPSYFLLLSIRGFIKMTPTEGELPKVDILVRAAAKELVRRYR